MAALGGNGVVEGGGSSHPASSGAAERAARELLALQSSDWAFHVHARTGGGLPGAAGCCPTQEFERALAAIRGDMRDSRDMRESNGDAKLRGLGPRPEAFGAAGAVRRPGTQLMRVLILSWEYPPLIEGGLARHVRKLSENLATLGVEVHVLTRGREEARSRS